MSNCPLCNLDPAPQPAGPNPGVGKRPVGFFRRAWQGVQWLFPAAFLVLMPKCPMCVAAYIALCTGIGVSVSTAWWIQMLMIGLCVTSLAYLAVRFWRRRFKARRVSASAS
jgi:hypothetical protein